MSEKHIYSSYVNRRWRESISGEIWPVVTLIVLVLVGGLAVGPMVSLSSEAPGAMRSPLNGVVVGAVSGFILWLVIWRAKRAWQKRKFYREFMDDF